MLRYFFISLILFGFNLYGQNNQKNFDQLSIGADLSWIAKYYMENGYQTPEVFVDLRTIKNLYFVVEAGMHDLKLSNNNISYRSSGKYGRIGVNYNLLSDDDHAKNDIMYAGLRYGYSSFSHLADNINIGEGYWGNFSGSIDEIKLDAQWMEMVIGMKVELFANIYLGWSIRGQLRTVFKDSETLNTYIIPGFGNANRNTSFWFNYSLYYNIRIRE